MDSQPSGYSPIKSSSSSRRTSRTPEPGLASYTLLKNKKGKFKPPAERPSAFLALAPLVFLAVAVLLMWPGSFSLLGLGVAGLGLVAEKGWAYQTIGDAITDWKNQPQSSYPTMFTRGIIPKGIRRFLVLSSMRLCGLIGGD